MNHHDLWLSGGDTPLGSLDTQQEYEDDMPEEQDLLQLDICAIHEWTPIQLVTMRARIDAELIRRENDLQRELTAVKRARGVDASKPRTLRIDGLPRATRKDAGKSRPSRAQVVGMQEAATDEVVP